MGTAYDFTPSAADADGDPLTFSVVGAPAWTSFDANTGRIAGTPAPADVGTTDGIVISVSDGMATTALPAFAIAVTQAGTGTATLRWNAPTSNIDGTPLLDLAGHKIYYGLAANALSMQITVNDPGITTYVVENLAPNTYYFAVAAVAASGLESGLSNVATITVN